MGQSSLYHGFQMLSGFGYSLHPSLVSAGPFVQLFVDTLNSLLCLGRGAKDKVQRQKTGAIGPTKGQHLESLEVPAAGMVKDPGQKFHHFRAGTVNSAVIKNQDFFPFLIGQQAEEADHLRRQYQHEFAPVMAWIFQQSIRRILAESIVAILHNTSVEILAGKRQQKNSTEQCQRSSASQFANAAPVQNGADVEITHEGINSILELFCFLLFLKVFGSMHRSPFFLILLGFSQFPIYQKVKGFSR